MFQEQAPRLLRDEWEQAKKLAQELYAIFANTKIPLSHEGPITLINGGGQAPLTLRGFGAQDVVIKVERPEDPQDEPLEVTRADLKPAPGAARRSTSQALVGEVREGGGDTYRVRLTHGGRGTVTATLLNATEDSSIPAGTQTAVLLADKKYYITVPVWL